MTAPRAAPPILLAPGLGGSGKDLLALTLDPASRVAVCDLHPATSSPQRPGFEPYSRRLIDAAEQHGARQGIGVSFGASCLLRAISVRPDLFTHAVIVLPFSFTTRRLDRADHFQRLYQAARQGDASTLAALLKSANPPATRVRYPPGIWLALAQQVRTPHVRPILSWLAYHPAVEDPGPLKASATRILVITHPQDADHTVEVARQAHEASPHADLTLVTEPGGVYFNHALMRKAVAGFLAKPALTPST